LFSRSGARWSTQGRELLLRPLGTPATHSRGLVHKTGDTVVGHTVPRGWHRYDEADTLTN
jgi:hypothetical protein